MKVIMWWKLSSDERYQVMKVKVIQRDQLMQKVRKRERKVIKRKKTKRKGREAAFLTGFPRIFIATSSQPLTKGFFSSSGALYVICPDKDLTHCLKVQMHHKQFQHFNTQFQCIKRKCSGATNKASWKFGTLTETSSSTSPRRISSMPSTRWPLGKQHKLMSGWWFFADWSSMHSPIYDKESAKGSNWVSQGGESEVVKWCWKHRKNCECCPVSLLIVR